MFIELCYLRKVTYVVTYFTKSYLCRNLLEKTMIIRNKDAHKIVEEESCRIKTQFGHTDDLEANILRCLLFEGPRRTEDAEPRVPPYIV